MNMLIIKNIKLLVIHCSDTKDSQNLSALDLHKMHIEFTKIGVEILKGKGYFVSIV